MEDPNANPGRHSIEAGADKGRCLLDLPKEIIFKIIQDIGFEDIQVEVKAVTCLAMTSKQSLLLVEAAAGCNLRDLVSLERRFGQATFNLKNISWALSQRDDLKEQYSDFTANTFAPNLDYLSLDGSLSWLTPLDDEMDEEGKSFRYCDLVTPEDLEKFFASAARMPFTLPAAYITWITDKELQDRLPAASCMCFPCRPEFVKCPADADQNAGGYLVRVMSDHRGCWDNYLYLDSFGGHCVLCSLNDIDDPRLEEVSESEVILEDFWIKANTFEEYLYHTWMNNLLPFTIPRGDALSEAQKLYIEQANLEYCNVDETESEDADMDEVLGEAKEDPDF